jgi:(p)ppGpp synthase/HD superfamily hydrolase
MKRDKIADAASMAAEAHAGQRYGAVDYTVHLAAVEGVLRRFDVRDEEMLAAAWLHDALEDTGLPAEEIAREFGARVLALVHAVTSGGGKNRRERNAATYPKILAGGTSAVTLKLADRIANVEASLAARDAGKLGMYRKEHAGFCAALKVNDGEASTTESALWEHLDWLFAECP